MYANECGSFVDFLECQKSPLFVWLITVVSFVSI